MFLAAGGMALSVLDAAQSGGLWLGFSVLAGIALSVVWVLSWRERERSARD